MAASHSTPAATRDTTARERDSLARFIVDEILNAPEEEGNDELKSAARKALRDANYTVFEEVRRD